MFHREGPEGHRERQVCDLRAPTPGPENYPSLAFCEMKKCDAVESQGVSFFLSVSIVVRSFSKVCLSLGKNAATWQIGGSLDSLQLRAHGTVFLVRGYTVWSA